MRQASEAGGWSPVPGAVGHEEQDLADAAEPVLQRGQSQEGQLGSAVQRQDGQQPPAPRRTVGTRLSGGREGWREGKRERAEERVFYSSGHSRYCSLKSPTQPKKHFPPTGPQSKNDLK